MAGNKPRDETTSIGPNRRQPGSDSDVDLSRDDMFHVLQCRRRRLVLKYMREYDGEGPARMSDIAERIATLEHDTTVEALGSKARQRVYIALYQSHLPKMDDIGVIEYDQDRGLVGTTELTGRIVPYVHEEPSLLPSEKADDPPAPGSPDGRTDTNADR